MGDRQQNTAVVGDVHGCFDELQALLEQLNLKSSDRLIFVGDLILKGPHNLQVLEEVRRLKAQVVMGNYELVFLEALAGKRPMTKEMAGLKQELGKSLSTWRSWIERLPAYLEFPDCLVVHAGLSPVTPPEKTSIKLLTSIRTWDGRGQEFNDE